MQGDLHTALMATRLEHMHVVNRGLKSPVLLIAVTSDTITHTGSGLVSKQGDIAGLQAASYEFLHYNVNWHLRHDMLQAILMIMRKGRQEVKNTLLWQLLAMMQHAERPGS